MPVNVDAIVVGAGPNGLSAAVRLLEAGLSVLVLEAHERVGGGLRSGEYVLPGFVHDHCASVLPLAAASPYLRGLPLREHGLRLARPQVAVAQVLGPGDAVALHGDPGDTAGELPAGDRLAYRRLLEPLVERQEELFRYFLGPLRFPSSPLTLARFGLPALLPAAALARFAFRSPAARALFAGLAAHSSLPLERPASAAFGLVLAMLGHSTGWPFAVGGSGTLADALGRVIVASGGRIETGRRVTGIEELPASRLVLFDLTPRPLLEIAGEAFSPRYRRTLERYRYGPGVFKIDYALSEPIPWLAEACRRAGTVHLGGSLNSIAAGERAVWKGEIGSEPFAIVAQPTLADPSRAPAGSHTAWAYLHVPGGSAGDYGGTLEAALERHAPGFREVVLGRRVSTARDIEEFSPNFVGGDINGGVQDLGQLFGRPRLLPSPYATSLAGAYLCSSATPPGGGAHGMSGYHAAQAALLWYERNQRSARHFPFISR